MNYDKTHYKDGVNTGTGNGLVPDDIKPIPEQMLTSHAKGPEVIISEQCHREY